MTKEQLIESARQLRPPAVAAVAKIEAQQDTVAAELTIVCWRGRTWKG